MSMRITNKIMNDQSVSNVNKNKTSLDKLNTQMSTGKKQSLLSDDPVIGIRALRFRGNLSEVTQYYGANVPDAKAWVGVSQKALDSTVELISDLKALCVQGSNGTYDAASRAKIYEDLMGTVKQVYHNGNANYAGRTVFTGYRTGENLTFDKDTTADYRGIADRFNASDVKIMTYAESPLTVDDINKISGNINETQVKEDRVNRIRLSYDNINGSVRTGVTEGFAHAESDACYYTYDENYNKDGSLKESAGSVELTMPNSDPDTNAQKPVLTFHDPYDQTMVPVSGCEYVNGKPVDQPDAFVDADGNIMISYARPVKDENGRYIQDASGNLVLGEFKFTITLTKDSSGNYSADKGVSVKKKGNDLTLTVPGPNGTTDLYTEIKLKTDGSGVTYQEKWRVTEANFAEANSNYGGEPIYGPYDYRALIYTTTARDTTTLVYRTPLSDTASIPQDTVKTDAVKGLQSFKVVCGSNEYTIKKFEDEDRWFAVDDSGKAFQTIKVTQNSDESFEISVATDLDPTELPPQQHYLGKEFDVFNVSANGRVVTSYYHETTLDVQITDSTSAVAVDGGGKELTAYQYLALNDNDVNTDPTAAKKIYLLADTGELVFGSDIADTLSSLKDIDGVDTISVKYDKSQFDEGDLQPEHYFDCIELTNESTIANPTVYDNYDQSINYSVGTRQKMQININACDAFDPQIIRTADDIINALEACNAAEDKVNKLKEMQNDTTAFTDEDREKIALLLEAAEKEFEITKNDLQKAYERGITEFGDYLSKANLAATDCGTIDNRLTLISNRLVEEQSTVKTLASENENVEITHVAVQVQESEMIYNSALQAIGKINQRSLVDYL
ncbi:MAG: hypothetical protein K6F86_12445 [Lachnospiraceae bacterium]|nr:hypothetical protein [Lachnospiraceae bacterium]